jgi:hypothetical protein
VLLAAVLAVVTVAGLGYAARVGLDAYRASLTLTGLTDDTTPVRLTIAGETLTVPGNMLRDPVLRAGGAATQADVVLHWPTLDGYTRSAAADFVDGSPSAPLVYGTIAGRTIALDPAARLEEIYTRYFTGDPLAAPTGLTARRLSADSGYEGEVVYYGPDGPNRFVARCLADATAETPATCIRDINFGANLTLLYRFNRDIISDWQALDAGMRGLTAQIVAN